MLSLSNIRRDTLLGRALRLPLRTIPRSAEVRILQGPLRGKKWVVGSSIHRCWLGSYEAAKQKKILEWVRPGMTCYDIGANVGFYSLLFSSLVGPAGSVVAFEPLPENALSLAYHLRINNCRNVAIRQAAVSDFDGFATFRRAEENAMGSLSDAGDLNVACCRLDTLVESAEIPPPGLLKVDVEGAEAALLQGAERTILAHRPAIFVATHGAPQHAACRRLLAGMDYRVFSLDNRAVDATDELLALPRERRLSDD
ncbi:MAG: FkbM family methyltransferase [Bryobacteraceae bacterium]|jgi:FkbM family methyltransferase